MPETDLQFLLRLGVPPDNATRRVVSTLTRTPDPHEKEEHNDRVEHP